MFGTGPLCFVHHQPAPCSYSQARLRGRGLRTSPDLAAGIRRVKGVKKHGMRIGNWLTADQGKRFLASFGGTGLRSKRDYATIAVLLGCGLRRAEVAGLAVEHLQQREEHWVVADLVGKGGHERTVPAAE